MKLRSTGKLFAILMVCIFSLGLLAQNAPDGNSAAPKKRIPAKPSEAVVAQQLQQLQQQLKQQQQHIAAQQNQIQQLQRQVQDSNSQLQQQTQRLQSGAEQALRDLAARNLQLQELKGEVTTLQERFGPAGQ